MHPRWPMRLLVALACCCSVLWLADSGWLLAGQDTHEAAPGYPIRVAGSTGSQGDLPAGTAAGQVGGPVYGAPSSEGMAQQVVDGKAASATADAAAALAAQGGAVPDALGAHDDLQDATHTVGDAQRTAADSIAGAAVASEAAQIDTGAVAPEHYSDAEGMGRGAAHPVAEDAEGASGGATQAPAMLLAASPLGQPGLVIPDERGATRDTTQSATSPPPSPLGTPQGQPTGRDGGAVVPPGRAATPPVMPDSESQPAGRTLGQPSDAPTGLPQAEPATTGASSGGGPGKLRLFKTMEFRGPLKALPKWQYVLDKDRKTPGLVPDRSFGGRGSNLWGQMADQWRKLPPLDRLRKVNSFFNQWPYRLDRETYGLEDFWAAPVEFLRNSGDCEDYAIVKYYALKQLGIPAENMRIVVLMDTIRGLGHAILAVYVNDNAYVLDNLSDVIMSHERYSHYVPQYSVNEFNRWAHIPVGKSPVKRLGQ